MHSLSRRQCVAATTATLAAGCRSKPHAKTTEPNAAESGVTVNDVHSQLNRTRVAGIEKPGDEDAVVKLIRAVAARGTSVSLCGGRHAGGGQQFRTDRTLIDLSGLTRIGTIDAAAGTVEAEAGVRWPRLLSALHAQANPGGWAIHQKQGGADELSLGGAAASNINGRCLKSRPFVQDVVALRVVTPAGDVVTCDRQRDAELFRHVIGGYGLFGVVTSVTLRPEKRRKLTRHVKWINADQAVAVLEAQRDAGALHGDFQFSIDPAADDFCTGGLCSWYAPVPDDTPVSRRTAVEVEGFEQLIALAHGDKATAMRVYRKQLESDDGTTVDWSDDWQRGAYADGYHAAVDAQRQTGPASEVLRNLRVPAGLAGVSGRGRAGAARGSGRIDLRRGAADRTRRRNRARLGQRTICLRDLQPRRAARAVGDRATRRRSASFSPKRWPAADRIT